MHPFLYNDIKPNRYMVFEQASIFYYMDSHSTSHIFSTFNLQKVLENLLNNSSLPNLRDVNPLPLMMYYIFHAPSVLLWSYFMMHLQSAY